MSRNPYKKSMATPELQNSVFVLMDILGYKEMISNAQKQNNGQQLLNELHQALSKGHEILNLSLKEFGTYSEEDFYVLKAFTDNIVIGYPIRDDGEMELGIIFSMVMQFQLHMILQGFFLRGAISIGQVFIDEIAVMGNALTEAYRGESLLARDPRVILTESSAEAVEKHLGYYGRKLHAPQARDLLKDADGQVFVNYLEVILIAVEEVGPYYDTLVQHKDAVEKKLLDFKKYPSIFMKYAWVAGYHNFFCDLHKQYFSDKYKIDPALYHSPPSLIISEP